jgi:hypothetical protein
MFGDVKLVPAAEAPRWPGPRHPHRLDPVLRAIRPRPSSLPTSRHSHQLQISTHTKPGRTEEFQPSAPIRDECILFYGTSAVPFIDDGHLSLQVWCKEAAGLSENDPVRYGIAITIEAETALPVYDETQARAAAVPSVKETVACGSNSASCLSSWFGDAVNPYLPNSKIWRWPAPT